MVCTSFELCPIPVHEVRLAPVQEARRTHLHEVDAAEAWDALLKGGWIVTDHFTDPHSHTMYCRPAPRGFERPLLSDSEVALATRRAQGALVKVLAAGADRSLASVSAQITSVMRKLKLRSHAQLVALFGRAGADGSLPAPFGLRATLVELSAEGRLMLVYPRPVWRLPPNLSSAEKRVVLDLIDGASHRDVARARGTSARTVANQVASIFRKLEVRSQLELFTVLRPRDGSP